MASLGKVLYVFANDDQFVCKKKKRNDQVNSLRQINCWLCAARERN